MASLGEEEGEGGGAAAAELDPHKTRFWVIVTLCVTVCVPGNSRTAMQSSPANPDASATALRTAWSELQVEFRTAASHGTELAGSTFICTLQLQEPSMQAREKGAMCPNSQHRTRKTNPA